jgi:SagB-type dehydrogenase family enzyme
VKECAVTFIWTLVPYRTIWRYGPGGCRDLLIEPGHVCQNLYLAAEAIGCGVCAITAFRDEDINRIIGIDGRNQLVIYVATLGKKK